MLCIIKYSLFVVLAALIDHSCACITSSSLSSALFFPSSGGKALAVIKGSYNGSTITGVVKFSQSGPFDSVVVSVNISGLPAGLGTLKHGFHIHTYGISSTSSSIADICNSAGSHYNPYNSNHGSISSDSRHVGDYGNVNSDNDGNIIAEFKDSVSQLYGEIAIVGRTVVLHELEDDLGLKNNTASLTTGNSGSRIACGVIGFF